MIGNSILMKLVAGGIQWHYMSYDHKAAFEEFIKTQPNYYMNSLTSFDKSNCGWMIPIEIKTKYPLWRIGKIWTVRFDRDGMVLKLYIGKSHRYAKCFYANEVGTNFKPILNINADEFDLIPAGLAVEESLVKS